MPGYSWNFPRQLLHVDIDRRSWTQLSAHAGHHADAKSLPRNWLAAVVARR